jgi:hypothetical protein
MAVRNACTPRWKSRLSYIASTVASSGNPSKNLSVPSRVSTESGVLICAGMSVVIFSFGAVGTLFGTWFLLKALSALGLV